MIRARTKDKERAYSSQIRAYRMSGNGKYIYPLYYCYFRVSARPFLADQQDLLFSWNATEGIKCTIQQHFFSQNICHGVTGTTESINRVTRWS